MRKSESLDALIKLCESKSKEIEEKDKQIEKIKNENQKLDKNNKEYKDSIKKKETQQQQLEADNEQLIREKCSVSKQALILEENNRSLRTIVSYLELEDVARNTEDSRNRRETKSQPEEREYQETDNNNVDKNTLPKKERPADRKKAYERNKPKDEHEEVSPKREPQRLKCWYYENAYCKFGNECKNIHKVKHKKGKDEIEDQRKGSEKNEGERQKRNKVKNQEFCWWDENDKCIFGSRCKNLHRGEKEPNTDKREDTKYGRNGNKGYCWWDEKNRCSFGKDGRN